MPTPSEWGALFKVAVSSVLPLVALVAVVTGSVNPADHELIMYLVGGTMAAGAAGAVVRKALSK